MVNDATVVGAEMVAAAAPSALGGAVAPGRYHLTKISVYTGPGGAAGPLELAIKETLLIQSGSVDVIQEANGKLTRFSASYVTDGTSLSMTPVCPAGLVTKPARYSGKSGAFVLFLQNDVDQTVMYEYDFAGAS